MRHSRFHNTHEGHCLPKIRFQRQEPLGHAVASGARILDISKATVETNSTTTAEGILFPEHLDCLWQSQITATKSKNTHRQHHRPCHGLFPSCPTPVYLFTRVEQRLTQCRLKRKQKTFQNKRRMPKWKIPKTK